MHINVSAAQASFVCPSCICCMTLPRTADVIQADSKTITIFAIILAMGNNLEEVVEKDLIDQQVPTNLIYL